MDVERFFHPYDETRSEREGRIALAKAVCGGCAVLSECRSYALAAREPYGIWGGLAEGERALILGVRTLRHPGARIPRDRGDVPAAPPRRMVPADDENLVRHPFGLGGHGVSGCTTAIPSDPGNHFDDRPSPRWDDERSWRPPVHPQTGARST